MSDEAKCMEYVLAMGMYVTCRCMLAPHGDDVAHECSCNGSWFGKDGQITKVITYPEILPKR